MILECLGGKKKYLDIFSGRSAFELRDAGVTMVTGEEGRGARVEGRIMNGRII